MGGHAIVVGGSMGGLLAACALAGTYSRVTVLDRDELPDDLVQRRAVPQGRHVHCLLPQGRVWLESLLPGIGDELAAADAPTCDALEQLRWIVNGFELARASTGLPTALASRPLIEGHVRRRVRALPGVDLVAHCEVLDLVPCRRARRVTGVRVARHGLEQTVEAELVVCATGRAAQVPAWLESLGFPRPRHERLALDIKYASRRLRPPDGALGGDRIVLVGARPGHARGLAFFAQENGEWLLTLAGYGAADRPPGDEAGFLEFADSVAPADVAAAIREAEPLAPIATHGFPASRRWRYDRLSRFPAGLLVIGDAISSINPLYGQGMTVAAAQAVALRECLCEGGERSLARRFFAAAWPATDDAWRIATGADLALPEVRGRRPLAVRAVNRYLRRLHAVAEHDPAAAAAFTEVVTMHERPSRLFRPPLTLRVLRGPADSNRPRRRVQTAPGPLHSAPPRPE
jgi:2-polyprenyl-6-methoxyphenol hydroxylase-like FAD-dependent oxidoreductase